MALEGTAAPSNIRVSALCSGSSGNAFLIEAPGVTLLIDAGLNATRMEYYMRSRGSLPSDLSAIFVSHEHIDHIRGVGMLARRYKVPVVASPGTFSAGAHLLGPLPEKVVQSVGSQVAVGGGDGASSVRVRTFAVSHDAAETTGFWIEAGGLNIVICTDLGCETPTIREALEASDLLVLEANHDTQRLWRGRYPPSLKRRVAGPYGHLANSEAARLVSELSADGKPRQVWLAHLSAANNTPALAFDAVIEPLRRDECAHIKLLVLERDRPSHVWHGGAREVEQREPVRIAR